MPSPPEGPDVGRLSRNLREALDAAITEHNAALASLRDAICAYHDALTRDGHTHDSITRLVAAVVANVELDGDGHQGLGAAKRQQRIDDMIAWCAGRRR